MDWTKVSFEMVILLIFFCNCHCSWLPSISHVDLEMSLRVCALIHSNYIPSVRFRMVVWTHGPPVERLKGFAWKVIVGYLTKRCRRNSVVSEMVKQWQIRTWEHTRASARIPSVTCTQPIKYLGSEKYLGQMPWRKMKKILFPKCIFRKSRVSDMVKQKRMNTPEFLRLVYVSFLTCVCCINSGNTRAQLLWQLYMVK